MESRSLLSNSNAPSALGLGDVPTTFKTSDRVAVATAPAVAGPSSASAEEGAQDRTAGGRVEISAGAASHSRSSGSPPAKRRHVLESVLIESSGRGGEKHRSRVGSFQLQEGRTLVSAGRAHHQQSLDPFRQVHQHPHPHNSTDLVGAINNALAHNGPPSAMQPPEPERQVEADHGLTQLAQGLSESVSVSRHTANPNIPRPPRMTNNSIVTALTAVFENNAAHGHGNGDAGESISANANAAAVQGDEPKRSNLKRPHPTSASASGSGAPSVPAHAASASANANDTQMLTRSRYLGNPHETRHWRAVDKALGTRVLGVSFDPNASPHALTAGALTGRAGMARAHTNLNWDSAQWGYARPWAGRTEARYSDAGSFKVLVDGLFGRGSMLRGFGRRPFDKDSDKDMAKAGLEQEDAAVESGDAESVSDAELHGRVMRRHQQVSPVKTRGGVASGRD